MSSGADLFVVCKQCGSEVSPYITECPYCGHRLRRRAPKLPREHIPRRVTGGPARWLRRLRPRSAAPASGAPRGSRGRLTGWAHAGREAQLPYVTIALVALGAGMWVAWRGGFLGLGRLIIVGRLHGQWWKLFSSQFAYINGLYAFIALLAVAVFGWLVERRRGPAVVLALFLGAGVTGGLAASAVYSAPIVSGANAGALALVAAWAAPDLRAARAGYYYEGDLLGAGAFAALLLALPFARPEASWLAGVTGGALGLVAGMGLHRIDPPEL